MKKALAKNNLGFKILAFCIAFLIWLIIMNIEDPVETKTYKDIPVEVLNEDAIQSLDQVYEIVSGDTVNIKVKAKQSILKRIKASDLRATADLSEAFNYAVPIKTSCPKYAISENIETTPDVSVMKISLEPIATEQFKITADMGDTVPETGYAIGEVLIKPNMIKVSGAKSQIERISEVRVKVDVSNVSEDFVKKLEPMVFDANGKQMDSSSMKFSTAEVRVSVKVLETKVIPINISTTGTPAHGYSLLATEYQPQTVEVSGSSRDLEKLNEISVVIDIDKEHKELEKTIDLLSYLPKGVNLVGTENTVTIKLIITQKIGKEILFYPKDITVKNKSDNLILTFDHIGQPLTVRIMGLENDIKNLTISSLKPYINIEHFEEGQHTVEVKFEGIDIDSIITVPSVSFNLKAGAQTTIVPEASGGNEVITQLPAATKKPETAEPKPTVKPAKPKPTEQPKPDEEEEKPEDKEEEGGQEGE